MFLLSGRPDIRWYIFNLSSRHLESGVFCQRKGWAECGISHMAAGSGADFGETYFLEPSPYNTVTAPGDSLESITVTAYQYRDNSLYVQASRGFMPDGNVVPQVAAPGVQIRVPQLNGLYGNASGTSLSAAQTAGSCTSVRMGGDTWESTLFYRLECEKLYYTRGGA